MRRSAPAPTCSRNGCAAATSSTSAIPNYWDAPKPYIDRMVCKFVPDAGARSIAFENGSADIGYRTPVALSDLERLEEDAAPRASRPTARATRTMCQTLQFNLDSQFFKNLKVRAGGGAHDRPRAADQDRGLRLTARCATAPIAPGPARSSTIRRPVLQARPQEGRGAARRGGLPARRRQGPLQGAARLQPDRRREPRAPASSCAPHWAVSASPSRCGRPDPRPSSKRVYTDREFDFTFNGHSNLFDPTVGVQRIYWSKNFKKGVPFSNGSHYDNPKVDALLEGAAVENDPVKRKQMFIDFQHIIAEEVPDIPLYSPLYLTIHNVRVHDHSLTADGVEANMAAVWLDAWRRTFIAGSAPLQWRSWDVSIDKKSATGVARLPHEARHEDGPPHP